MHVPFCLAKCRYCDFYSVRHSEPAARAFVAAVREELASRQAVLAAPLETVFLGGGTPTVLGGELLGELLSCIRPLVDDRTEISVEANPGTVDAGIAEAMAAVGVNRVSLGVQSFQAEELRLLGRVHSAEDARRTWRALRAAGIGNLSLDLIYGIPNQTLARWRTSVAVALSLAPQHLSCYGLTYEPGTALAADLRAGRVAEMDEQTQEQCYRHAIEAAAQVGLEHYEISNFARPGRRCRHNLVYWRNLPYVGLGPGATSYVGGLRHTNLADWDGYLEAARSGRPLPARAERLTGRRAMAETVMLALRLTQGLDRKAFESRYGRDAARVFPRSIARHVALGTLAVTDAQIRIRSSGLFVADSVMADFIAEA